MNGPPAVLIGESLWERMFGRDLAAIERYRAEWGFFRDRRTDLYAKTLI